MKSSKVIQYLQTLTSEEWKRFDRFVRSPYFHSHEETILLWQALYPLHPGFEEEALQKEQVFARMFPGATFDERKLYNLSKYLLRLLEDFLMVEKEREEGFRRNFLTRIPLMSERGLDRYLPRLFRQAEEELNQLSRQHVDHALLAYQYAFLKLNYTLTQDNRSVRASVSELSGHLDRFFVLEKLKQAVTVASRNFILASETEPDFVEEALLMYQNPRWEENHLITAYYLAWEMFISETHESGFQAYAAHLKQNGEALPRVELQALYYYGLNFCSIQSKRDHPEYLERMFELFQEMLAIGLLLSDPSTAAPNFKNAVTLGIKLKEYEWVADFIHQYGPLLPESHRQVMVSYSLANLAYTRKEYSTAQTYLQEVAFMDAFYRLTYDILLLKIYYETSEADALYSRCRAVNKFIQRDRSMADQNRKAYGNFVKLIYRLARLSFDHKGKKERVEELIKKTRPLVERQWLMEKIS